MWSTCLLFVTITVGLAALGASRVESMACPSKCTCRWKGGKETAECIGKRLFELPTGLSLGTQVLDISRNSFEELPQEAFFRVGLHNLQKLRIAECKIRKIHDNAFSHLANLVELDLENNLLIAVPSETFIDFPGLRRLNLNRNHIRRIESNAFTKLPSLAFLEMRNCFLEYIGSRAFYGLNHLEQLNLDRNQLSTLPADVGLPIASLRSLYLDDNPWHCDCDLRMLRNLLFHKKLPVNAQPVCAEPARLEGQNLVDIKAEDYACEPQVSTPWLEFDAYSGERAFLSCNVHADPPAEIRWSRDGRILPNHTRTSSTGPRQTYTVTEEGTTNRISFLSISTVTSDDAGEYICMAENVAGQAVTNVTLAVISRSAEASSMSNGHIAGISIGLVLVSMATIVLIFVLLARMRHQQSEESKHLTLDKKHDLHLVNHVKFDVTKEKLEMMTENSVHKPLCSMLNSNYNSNTPLQDKIRLEDSIGGSTFRTSSSCIINNKPDVVNFTCVLPSPQDDVGIEDNLIERRAGDRIARFSSSVKDQKHEGSGDTRLATDVISSNRDNCTRNRYALSTSRTESKERLCDYVQLYDEAAADSPVRHPMDHRPSDVELSTECRNSDLQRRLRNDNNVSDRNSAGRPEMTCSAYTSDDVPASHSCDKGATLHSSSSGIASGDAGRQQDGYELHLLAKEATTGEWDGKDLYCQVVHSNGRAPVPATKTGSKAPGAVKRYAPLGNASGILKHANLHGRNYVPVLPPLPAHHFAQARDSPDEGYEDEVEEDLDM